MLSARPLFLLPEHLEDVRQELRGDAFAGIGDPDDGGVSVPFGCHSDPSTRGGEFQGVGEDVREDLLKPARVSLDGQGLVSVAERDVDLSCSSPYPQRIQHGPFSKSGDRERQGRAASCRG